MNIIFNFTNNKAKLNNYKERDLIPGKLYCTFCQEGYILMNNSCFKDYEKAEQIFIYMGKKF